MGRNATTRAHVDTPAPIADDHASKNVDAQAFVASANDSPPVLENPISRRDKRKQKKHNRIADLPTPPSSDTEPARKRTPNNPARQIKGPQSSASIRPTLIPMPLGSNAATKSYPLLICSVGNPGSTYANTLHSAGHTILSHLASRKNYRPFTKGLSGLVSRPDNTTYSFGVFRGFTKEIPRGPPEGGDDWTFWQSTSLMNVSGKGVKKAWNEFSSQIRGEGLEARLVVVHDELESALGKVTVKDGGASAKGHNGLKSCQASLGGVKWWRVGVGIGRPESRAPDVVAQYVLRKMNGGEMRAMEKASVGVFAALREISEGKR
ncbi:hypothetical protein N0V90_001834 [Kalmusia sp. IMI 367209]|nr:hypothetical protein N0V90_001834 [Kalmusia sp. IMI 367209]